MPAASHQTGSSSAFPPTHWSLVLHAKSRDPEALSSLCRAYWYPIYCCARRLTPSAADAEDLTQGYFATLLRRESLRSVNEEAGRLRSFLITGLRRYAAEQHRRGTAQKRGGGQPVVEFDALDAEQRYALEPRDESSPEREFDRVWARQLLASVLAKLGQSYREAGKAAVFEALQGQLTGTADEDYASVAAQLGISAGGARFAAFKLRGRFRELLRASIQETVTTEQEAEEELAHLRELFGR